MKTAGKIAAIPLKLVHRVFGALAFLLIMGLACAGLLILAVVLLGAAVFALMGVALWFCATALLASVGHGLIGIVRAFDPEYSATNVAEKLQRTFTTTASKVVH